MTIKAGEGLPAGTLMEMTAEGPRAISIDAITRGRRVVLFALPGAFTPTCSTRHVPGYLDLYDKLKAYHVEEIACLSVNDAYVMGAWARELNTEGKIRMLADGSAKYTRALGLEVDLNEKGMGLRSRRYSMLIDDGKLIALNVEEAGKFEVSDAETMVYQLSRLA
ncbi:MAG: redoxin family protein [Acidiferrobacterales bacterium]